MAKPPTMPVLLPRPFEVSFEWHLKIGAQPGWRGRFARLLRRLAIRLDGAWTLAVTFDTTPAISQLQQRQVIAHGTHAMECALRIAVRESAVDQALAEVYPELQEPRIG